MTSEDLVAQRAVNMKAYLVTEKGVDTSRVQVRTGTNRQDEAENDLVPTGANFDNEVQGTTAEGLDVTPIAAGVRFRIANVLQI